VAAARGNSPSTGSGSELYAVIGHAPRQLDRNLAVLGRVIDGMAHLSARPRGSGNLGFYDRARGETPAAIARVRLASDIPAAERPRFEVMRTDAPAFAAYVTGSANRHDAFFAQPAGGVDVCNARVPVRPRPGGGA
jgi:peptidylprolyl isomerase